MTAVPGGGGLGGSGGLLGGPGPTLPRRTRRAVRRRRDDREISRMYRPTWVRFTRALALWPFFVASTAAIVAAPILAPVVVADRAVSWLDSTYFDFAPAPDHLARPAVRSFVRAADGSLLATLHAEENREPVPLDRIPVVLQRAVLATEDRDFYAHDGLDERAVLRALAANVRARDIEQGASTLTQQLVKNLWLTNEVTLERKVQEAAYAIELERRLSKDEILEIYLNLAYFGNGAYGVAAATEFYFGHDLASIRAEEAALLAGIIRAPGTNDPLDNPDAALGRRDIVLGQMRDAGWLSATAYDTAVRRPMRLDVAPTSDLEFPFVVEYVKQLLLDDPRIAATPEDRVDAVFRGGLTIETTIDPVRQRAADAAIGEYLTDPEVDPLGAIISLDPRSGEIVALGLGPKQFGTCPDDEEACDRTKVNPAVPQQGGSGRQPGSSFKPFVLAAALEAGIPHTWRTDTRSEQPIPGCFKADESLWAPRNYDGTSAGVIDMYEAIRRSNNVFHAKLGREVGPGRVATMANRLGITTEVPPVCANALGAASVFPLDMTVAYATFANGGQRCRPIIVSRVSDRDGNVLIDESRPDCRQVLDPVVAARVADMLQGVVRGGTGTAARLEGREVAGKTGTTNDFNDAWFVGMTPQLVSAVWMGYEQPTPMLDILGWRRVTGGSIPARIWHSYATVALEDAEVLEFPDPDDLARDRG